MPVRIAVVGAGKFGQTHLDVFTQLGDEGIELAAIAEADPARAEAHATPRARSQLCF